MLILTRKSGESIRIGNDVVVHILESSSKHMKIGISAPRDIPVYRDEVYARIQEENRASAIKTADPGSVLDGIRMLKQSKGSGEHESGD